MLLAVHTTFHVYQGEGGSIPMNGVVFAFGIVLVDQPGFALRSMDSDDDPRIIYALGMCGYCDPNWHIMPAAYFTSLPSPNKWHVLALPCLVAREKKVLAECALQSGKYVAYACRCFGVPKCNREPLLFLWGYVSKDMSMAKMR